MCVKDSEQSLVQRERYENVCCCDYHVHVLDGWLHFPGVGEQGDLLRVIKRERLLEMGGGRRPQEMFVSESGRP